MSLLKFLTAARKTMRPMRPKPLMPILTMMFSVLFLSLSSGGAHLNPLGREASIGESLRFP
jgi:hypothetical protein